MSFYQLEFVEEYLIVTAGGGHLCILEIVGLIPNVHLNFTSEIHYHVRIIILHYFLFHQDRMVSLTEMILWVSLFLFCFPSLI